MNKIKVTTGNWVWGKRGSSTTVGVSTYTYSVYLFWILINTITIHNITHDEAIEIFGKRTPK